MEDSIMKYRLKLTRTARKCAYLVFVFLLCHNPAAAGNQYTLSGRISDTSDNLLPDVRVALKRAGVLTRTDGNGKFSLSFNSDQPLTKDKKDVYDYLEIDKDGYQGRTVNILELSIFEKPLAEKLEPNPIGKDNVGFSTRMSMDYILPHNTVRPNPPEYLLIGESQWKDYFKGVENKKKDGVTERVFFHVYVPENVKTVKAAFLISRHGMGSIDHPVLRDFAGRHGIALVGILGDPLQRGFHPVSIIDEHLKKLGQMVNHPELATVPVLTFGHSNGTGFAAILPSQRPDRVIAWISYHSGASYHLQFPGVEKVPGLAMHGNMDQFVNAGQEQTVKNLRKYRNAALGMMMEGNVGHGPVDKGQNATWGFIVEFCEAAMRIRLNDDGTLRPVVIEQGWLGSNYDRSQGGQQELDIAPYAEFKGDRSIVNWLPDRKFAETWRLYGKTDPRPVK
jgi:hypothetical protein